VEVDMNKLVPYITVFDVKDLINTYKDAFKEVEVKDMLMLEDVEGMEKYAGKVGHAEVELLGNTIYLCDKTDKEIDSGNNFHFTLELKNEDDLNNAFNILKEEATIYHEIKELFWCDKSFYLKDRFDIAWSIFIGMK